MNTKIKMTLLEGLINDRIKNAYEDILLTAALQIKDGVSIELIRSRESFQTVDLDNAAAFDEYVDRWSAANDAFLNCHQFTKVEL